MLFFLTQSHNWMSYVNTVFRICLFKVLYFILTVSRMQLIVQCCILFMLTMTYQSSLFIKLEWAHLASFNLIRYYLVKLLLIVFIDVCRFIAASSTAIIIPHLTVKSGSSYFLNMYYVSIVGRVV